MTNTRTVRELKKTVALACRILGTQGITRGSAGHVSVRIPGTDRVLIKSRGPREAALEFATVRDIITIDLTGKVLEASQGLEAPHETAMHLAVYRARPDVRSVIHTHPDFVVALTACGKPLLPIYAAYNPPGLRLLLEGIPLYPRSVTIATEELGEDFMKVMGEKTVCLLLGHGMTTVGTSVEEATLTSLTVYELARMNYLAYALGEPTPVPEKDIAEYKERWARGRGRRREGRSPEENPGWRYHLQLLAQESRRGKGHLW